MYISLTRSAFDSYVMSDLRIPTCYCIPKANRWRGQKSTTWMEHARNYTNSRFAETHTRDTLINTQHGPLHYACLTAVPCCPVTLTIHATP